MAHGPVSSCIVSECCMLSHVQFFVTPCTVAHQAPLGFFRVAMGLLTYDGEFRLPLVLAQGCEGEMGVALESL